ncbi:MAG: hypothetical protein KIPDCIKN_00389 [Haliscomenobacter sp.]|nr:hypothetical protein [Haliscomenobacter sp.]
MIIAKTRFGLDNANRTLSGRWIGKRNSGYSGAETTPLRARATLLLRTFRAWVSLSQNPINSRKNYEKIGDSKKLSYRFPHGGNGMGLEGFWKSGMSSSKATLENNAYFIFRTLLKSRFQVAGASGIPEAPVLFPNLFLNTRCFAAGWRWRPFPAEGWGIPVCRHCKPEFLRTASGASCRVS